MQNMTWEWGRGTGMCISATKVKRMEKSQRWGNADWNSLSWRSWAGESGKI